MKGGGRSVSAAAAAAAEEWVDGSWTVDCVCGVNFDDGEEMVNCDDCGVWVHTRCSRYVKGHHFFTCHKCKLLQNATTSRLRTINNNNNNNNNSNHFSEETEVAQLLVELPTKSIPLDAPPRSSTVNVPLRSRPSGLWSDVPIQDRVHVQGVPGGDPALFTGLGGSVFGPALWKCSGYVPKKFGFVYREFPCWDDDDEKEKEKEKEKEDKGRENEGLVDKDAGVLFLLSKESGLGGSAGALRGRHDEESGRMSVKEEGKREEFRGLQFRVKKERSLLRPAAVQSGKAKQDDLRLGKDQSVRNKAGATAGEPNMEKRSPLVSRSAFTTTSGNGKQSEFYGDTAPKLSKSDSHTAKSKNSRDIGISSGESDGYNPASNGVSKVKDDLTQASSVDRSGHNLVSGAEQKEGKAASDDSIAVKSPREVDNVAASLLGLGEVQISVKQEGECLPTDNNIKYATANDVKPPSEGLASAVPEIKGAQIDRDNEVPSMHCEIKQEVDDNKNRDFLNSQISLTDVRDAGVPSDELSVGSEQLSVSALGDHASQDIEKDLEELNACHIEQGDVKSGNACQVGREIEGSEGLMPMPMPKEQSKSPTTSQPRTSISEERLPSILSSAVNAKSTSSDNFRDPSAGAFIKDANMHEISRKAAKEHQRSFGNAASKAPNSSKTGRTATQRAVSDTKDSVLLTSSKVSPMQNPSGASGSQQDEAASQMQNNVSVRGDKFSLSHSHPSKANHWPLTSASAPTDLSDEQLALLLHHQLNSSPRVPRVPRVQNAGSYPQLASPTAASMFLNRTSSSGLKDHGPFSRRKNKDVSKDAFRRSRERDDGAKKTTNRMPSSPDLRQRDSGNPSSRREDGGFSVGSHSVKKNVPPTSTSTANSGPSSSAEVNDNHLSSSRNSPGNTSDEETARGPVHRTLPGLINEIMSKGRRMTYQELCNAVLPHWNNLRKHNGERYAYSSPSQAVLDCLRNRHEWARLVDRGPKTNSNRKRRKFDMEESEDNGYSKGRSSKEGEGKSLESQREDFPKGKRKARKRKLSSQGRGMKEVKKRRKADSVSDDDSGTFSNSSEQSSSSEDEVQGGGAGSDGSEASVGSDDADEM